MKTSNTTTKLCPKCGRILKKENFYVAKNRSDGLRAWCINCESDNQKQYYKSHPEKQTERYKRYREKYLERELQRGRLWIKNNPIQANRNNRKWKSKQRGLGYIEIFPNPFPTNIEVDYHHINNIFVIPIPTIIHRKYHNNHKSIMKKIIESMYGINIDIFINPEYGLMINE